MRNKKVVFHFKEIIPSFHKVSSSTSREEKGREVREETDTSPVSPLYNTMEGVAFHIWSYSERWTKPTPAAQLHSLNNFLSAVFIPGKTLSCQDVLASSHPLTHPSFPGSCVLALLQPLGYLHLPLPAMKTF